MVTFFASEDGGFMMPIDKKTIRKRKSLARVQGLLQYLKT